jgi:hypothetical protein
MDGSSARKRTVRETLVEARTSPFATFDEAAEACLPALTARVWATCGWVGDLGQYWKIGDYNYLVLSVKPSEDTSLYVQFWSEPQESVLAEISSGERNPGALQHVWHRQRQQIADMGYAAGGKAGNFRKDIQVRSSAEAAAVAEEALRIFFDVFGYRGQWPLLAEWHHGERAAHDAVHMALTPDDVAKVAAHAGFEVDAGDGSQPAVLLRHGRRHFVAGLSSRVPGQNLYSRVTLVTLVTSRRPIENDTLARVHLELGTVHVCRHNATSVLLSMPLRLDGGVTVAWLEESLREWLSAWRRCERLLVSASQGSSSRIEAHEPEGSVIH